MYTTYIYKPLYNGFIYLMDAFPWMDAGIAIIVFTLIIKFVLFPLSKKAIVTQLMLKKVEPEIKAIKDKNKGNNQAVAVETMALYKKYGINPLANFFLLLIQLPILFALYSVFMKAGLPDIKIDFLYSFVSVPTVNMNFLGFLDIGKPNVIAAIIASVCQYIQINISLPKIDKKNYDPSDMSQAIAKGMNTNMKYFFPVIILLISIKLASAIALYWIVSSLFMIGQELLVKRRLEKQLAENGNLK